MRSNVAQLEELCRTVASRFPHLRSVNFNAAIPSGLASRSGFADHELLTDTQVQDLVGAELTARLTAAAPGSVHVFTTDNMMAMMHPDRIAHGNDALVMQVEPDGEVRAMSILRGHGRRSPGRTAVGAVGAGGGPLEGPVRGRDPDAGAHDAAVGGTARRIDYRFGSGGSPSSASTVARPCRRCRGAPLPCDIRLSSAPVESLVRSQEHTGEEACHDLTKGLRPFLRRRPPVLRISRTTRRRRHRTGRRTPAATGRSGRAARPAGGFG
ncbi:hypothetical protein ACRAWF_10125 [Streptomyces sp. L7]